MNEKAPNAQTQAAMTEARLMARTRDFKETVATRVQSALRGHGVLPVSLREFQRPVRYGVSPAYWVKPRPRADAAGDGPPG